MLPYLSRQGSGRQGEYMRIFLTRYPGLILLVMLLSFFYGCAAQIHTSNMASLRNEIAQNGVCPIGDLEKKSLDADGNVKDNADLIQLLELGAMYPLQDRFARGNLVLEAAYHKYTQYDERAKFSARSAATDMMDVLLAEGAGEYEMAPYEKVFMHNVKAMNYLMLGRADEARVEVRRGIDQNRRIRENAEFKAARIKAGEEKARKQSTENEQVFSEVDKQIPGLCRKTSLDKNILDSIRVLRNSYENSFSYLLSGLVFGLNKELENARPQLKNANALTDNRYVKRLYSDYKKEPSSLIGKNNVFVFALTGFAPTKENLEVPFYNPVSQTASKFSMATLRATPNHVSIH